MRGAVVDRALQRRQHAERGLEGIAVVKAGARAGVAGRPGRLDQGQDRVCVAVIAQRPHGLRVARGLALMPQLLARAAEEVRLAGLAGALEASSFM